MDIRVFTLQEFARRRNDTIADFPVSFWEVAPGKNRPGQYHTHDSVELAIITGGTGVHLMDGRRAPVGKGDVLLIYPNHRHGYEECESLSLINIMYDPARLPFPVLDGDRIPLFGRFFPQRLDRLDFAVSPEPVLHFDDGRSLERVADEARLLCQELTSSQPGNMLASTSQLLHVILRLLRLGTPMAEDEREVRVFPLGRILEHINQNFTGAITVEKLARMSIYSRSTFQHKFKELTGYGVTEYVLRKRIALAQKLLRKEPDRLVGDVGFDCGFLDANYFCRQFRKITGMSPRECRKAKEAPPHFVG